MHAREPPSTQHPPFKIRTHTTCTHASCHHSARAHSDEIHLRTGFSGTTHAHSPHAKRARALPSLGAHAQAHVHDIPVRHPGAKPLPNFTVRQISANQVARARVIPTDLYTRTLCFYCNYPYFRTFANQISKVRFCTMQKPRKVRFSTVQKPLLRLPLLQVVPKSLMLKFCRQCKNRAAQAAILQN